MTHFQWMFNHWVASKQLLANILDVHPDLIGTMMSLSLSLHKLHQSLTGDKVFFVLLDSESKNSFFTYGQSVFAA